MKANHGSYKMTLQGDVECLNMFIAQAKRKVKLDIFMHIVQQYRTKIGQHKPVVVVDPLMVLLKISLLGINWLTVACMKFDLHL